MVRMVLVAPDIEGVAVVAGTIVRANSISIGPFDTSIETIVSVLV